MVGKVAKQRFIQIGLTIFTFTELYYLEANSKTQ